MNIKTAAMAATSPLAIAVNQPEHLIPAPAVACEFGVTRRTLGRWFVDENLDFPKPTEINRRLYFRRAELEDWKAIRLRKVTEAR